MCIRELNATAQIAMKTRCTCLTRCTIDGLRQQIIEHFAVSADEADQDFVFSTENIHTHCLGYDAGDWTQFIVIRRK